MALTTLDDAAKFERRSPSRTREASGDSRPRTDADDAAIREVWTAALLVHDEGMPGRTTIPKRLLGVALMLTEWMLPALVASWGAISNVGGFSSMREPRAQAAASADALTAMADDGSSGASARS